MFMPPLPEKMVSILISSSYWFHVNLNQSFLIIGECDRALCVRHDEPDQTGFRNQLLGQGEPGLHDSEAIRRRSLHQHRRGRWRRRKRLLQDVEPSHLGLWRRHQPAQHAHGMDFGQRREVGQRNDPIFLFFSIPYPDCKMFRYMETLPDKQIGAELCQLLTELTGKPLPHLRSINVTRWYSNPYQLGAYR